MDEMDPETALKEIRECVRLAAEGIDVRHNERNLRWKFQELDAWLSNGGFLPTAWAPGRRVHLPLLYKT